MTNNSKYKIQDWLPTTLKEVKNRGWEQLDIILFTGDAYIDHPSFGASVIGRVLEAQGFKVAIIPQPNWQDDLRDFKKLGEPRLFFGVTSGSMDSMINHYTANRRLRSDDAYTPNGKSGFRPDYATTVYANNLKELFPDTPLIIGGIEASLRRLTHYDYWSNELKPSIIIESKADLLVYGMGEKSIIEIAKRLDKGEKIEELKDISQTIFFERNDLNKTDEFVDFKLFSHEECFKSKEKFAKNFRRIEEESNKQNAYRLLQKYETGTIVVNPPYSTMTTKEIDSVYDLPYTRLPHPKYKDKTIPAFEMIKFSVNIHRGCFGGCSFCTISAHQGKQIVSRSEKSIISEVKKISKMPDFKGNLSDLGAPSANMYKMQGKDLEKCNKCKRPSCIHPKTCPNINLDHKPLLELYKKVRNLPEIKRVFIGSGVRYDLFFDELNRLKPEVKEYVSELILHHVSGRLKVAPEHTSDIVLDAMRKPSFELFKRFSEIFHEINRRNGLNQQLIPYFISSHPNCKAENMAELAVETKNLNFHLEQVQDFTPSPMTLSTVMYYSGLHPYTLKKVNVARTREAKLAQRKFFFWYKAEEKSNIRYELKNMGRNDLIDKLFGKDFHSKKYKNKKKRR